MITFVYDHKYPQYWRDGLAAALDLLEEEGYEIERINLQDGKPKVCTNNVVIGWGAFRSPVDNYCKDLPNRKALCIAGVTEEPSHSRLYDVVFYETDWFGKTLRHPNKIKAFGINTDIYREVSMPKMWDTITVGAFALWKRQDKLLGLDGRRIAVGEVQEDNLRESMSIVWSLLKDGVMVSPMVEPETLSLMYNSSFSCYIPADIYGGGERAVLEARACGLPVTVESDNPKLKELVYGPVYSHKDYAEQLKKGLKCLLEN